VPSDELYRLLAEAKSRPSGAYRAAKAALDVPEQTLLGYLSGSDIGEKLRQRKLDQQTLLEALGGNVPEGLAGFSRTPVSTLSSLAPAITAAAALEKAGQEKKIPPQKFQQGSFLVGGKLTRFDPVTGQYETTETPGNAVPSRNPIVGRPDISPRVPPTIPVSETEKLSELSGMKEALGVIKQNFSPDFVGPMNARLLTAKQTTGYGATGKGALFTQSVQDIKDRLLRARSGAQINEQEYQRLVSLVPDQYKSVPDFIAKLGRFDQILNATISSKRAELMRAGYRGASSLPNTANPEFATEEEANASGYKGPATIAGRKAIIH